jgi:small subunit ribosomal protein S11
MPESPPPPRRPARRKIHKTISIARACITAGYNNTIITITDLDGDVLATVSAGSCGFEGTRKSTPYAAKVAAEAAAERAKTHGVEAVHVEVRGAGPGYEQAIRGLQGAGLDFKSIVDRTPIPHGGCRPRRRRRV